MGRHPCETYEEIESLCVEAKDFPAVRQRNAKRIVDLALAELQRIRDVRGVEAPEHDRRVSR
jgi:hypothetical protein